MVYRIMCNVVWLYDPVYLDFDCNFIAIFCGDSRNFHLCEYCERLMNFGKGCSMDIDVGKGEFLNFMFQIVNSGRFYVKF